MEEKVKWEYVTVRYADNAEDDMLAKHMNIWGKQGWELVSVDNNRAYFKRQFSDKFSRRFSIKIGIGENDGRESEI